MTLNPKVNASYGVWAAAFVVPLLLAVSVPGAGAPTGESLQWLQPGHRVHMTGCVNGRLRALRIDLFQEPPGTISPRVARVPGTSRKQICDGEVVIVHEVLRVRGDLAVLVEPLRDDLRGWVSSHFIGVHFPLYKCHTHFQDKALVEKCLHGEPAP